MDRFVNLGTQNLAQASAQGDQIDVLPCDDEVWDRGECGSNEALLPLNGSNTDRLNNTKLGSFALACQAAHFLGRVIRHRDDSATSNALHLAEAILLDRASLALMDLLHEQISAVEKHKYAAPSSANMPGILSMLSLVFCLSARLILCDTYACETPYSREMVTEEKKMQQEAMQGLREIAERVVELACYLNALPQERVMLLSPFVSHCLYFAASEYVWFSRSKDDEVSAMALQQVMSALQSLSLRWRVCGKLIEGSDDRRC